jgi:Putative threonine efflux protein
MGEHAIALAAVAGMCLVKILIPGPSLILLMQCTMRSGRRAGVAMASGMVTGDGFYASLMLVGLPHLPFDGSWGGIVVRTAGAGLLMGLGVHMLWQGHARPAAGGDARPRGDLCFLAGLLSNVANPLTVPFLLGLASVLPALDRSYSRPWVAAAALVLVSVCARGGLVVVFSSHILRTRYLQHERLLTCAGGTSMIVMAWFNMSWTLP